ncbi:hypothetical protein [Paraburkholderia sp. BL21I4N1]|uniref:hypothetical protein n=1 Tax=Paraburkholderia sp. BL21I4N1 TaxID=1938801 RepID=UPI0011B1F40F|nr:hypothetical protein [Paraburkholderia sp. BL21I4N1]
MNRLYGSRRREARAINSRNLSWSETDCSDVDYLAARAMSGSPLGSILERLKFGGDASVYGACADLLSEKFSRRTKRSARKSLVHAALHEYLDDRCVVCTGRSAEPEAIDAVSGCVICKGTGFRPYGTAERAHMASIAVDSWRRYEADYLTLLDCLRSAADSHRRGMDAALADPADSKAS